MLFPLPQLLPDPSPHSPTWCTHTCSLSFSLSKEKKSWGKPTKNKQTKKFSKIKTDKLKRKNKMKKTKITQANKAHTNHGEWFEPALEHGWWTLSHSPGKSQFFLPSRCLLQIASRLGRERWVLCPASVLGFCLAWTQVLWVQSQSLLVHTCIDPICVQKTWFP